MIEIIGGPDRDRTDDLFHAMEARSQLRHRPTVFYSQGQGYIESNLRLFINLLGGNIFNGLRV